MKTIILHILMLCATISIAQNTPYNNTINDQYYNEFTTIEDYILDSKIDSAQLIFSTIESNVSEGYKEIITRILHGNPTNEDLFLFTISVSTRSVTQNMDLHFYLEKNLLYPEENNEVDLSFAKAKWKHIIFLTNAGVMDKAQDEFDEYAIYVSQFDQNDLKTKRAIFYKNTYLTVLEVIKRNSEKLTKICNENEAIAKELNDTALLSISNFYFSEFARYNITLDEFIELCESSLKLENQLKQKTSYYYDHISNLLDVSIYVGGYDARVKELFAILEKTQYGRNISLSYYIQFIKYRPINDSLSIQVYNKFGVDNPVSFCDTVTKIALDKLVTNEYISMLHMSAILLHKFKKYNDSYRYFLKSHVFMKNVYSNKLVNQLASTEIKQTEAKKQLEIANEKNKSIRQRNIAFFTIILLVIALISIYLQIKNNRKLKLQKEKITIQDKEKQILLKEIHHRVKNNFQIVSSLLELQNSEIDNDEIRSITQEGQNRIKSMALIHQRLYQNDDLHIDFEDYVKHLAESISIAYSSYIIKTKIEIEQDYKADIDTAIPLGLILNELITNSFKYAFHNIENKQISIKITKKEDSDILIYSDNGIGLPENFDIKKIKGTGIGISLVRDLTKQLFGKLTSHNDNGAVFEIEYKDTHQRRLID